MSGSLNDLLQGQSSGSVLGAIAHPNVANPLAALQAGQQAATTTVDLRQKQFNLQQAQLQPAYQAMRQVMATNPNPSWDDVNNALAQSARIGGNIDGLVANANETMARGGKPGDFMRAYALGGMSPENQVTMSGQQPVSVETGAGTVFGTRGGPLSAAPGQFNPNSVVQQGFTPGQASEFISVPDVDANGRPTGTYHLAPRSTVVSPTGGFVGAGAGGGGGAVGGANQPAGAYGQGGPGANAKVPDEYMSFFQEASRRTGIPAEVLIAQARQESGLNPNAVGRGGEIGLGQIMPSTAANPGFGLSPVDPKTLTDPRTNINFSADYLKAHLPPGANPNDPAAIRAALHGYNGGGDPNYVANVTRYLPASMGGAAASGPFIGATTAQPVTGGGATNVQPAGGGGGVRYFSPSGQPLEGPGGGGGPILRPVSPYEQPQLEQSSKDYVADQVNNKTLSRRIAPLQNAISIIKENPGLVTGPSSENWYQWVQGLAAASGIDVGDVHNANAYNELAKQLAMNLQQSGADPSDMARLMHEASQPNTMQGKQAIVTLAAEQIGYQRLKSAQYLEFRSRHPTDANTNAQFYNQETGDWAGQQDPMAYAADMIPQAELQAHLRGLNSDQQRAFGESLINAKRLFKIKLPTPQGGQNAG
jgi:hypothetical protein